MSDYLKKLEDRTLVTLFRCAKTRGRAFFGNPKLMIELRKEIEARGLN